MYPKVQPREGSRPSALVNIGKLGPVEGGGLSMQNSVLCFYRDRDRHNRVVWVSV